MAAAFVGRVRLRDKRTPSTTGFIVTVYFTGADVPVEIEGIPFEVDMAVAEGYSLGEFKTAMGTAVQNLASQLGVTVVASDIDLPSYEAGGGPPP